MNGFVTQIIGPVIDVEFPEGQLPKIYNALKVTKELSGEIIIAANTPAGVYTIGLSATNESGTGEMTLVYTVSTKELTIEANDVLKCFGVNHSFNTSLFSSNGLVPGETITSVDMSSD